MEIRKLLSNIDEVASIWAGIRLKDIKFEYIKFTHNKYDNIFAELLIAKADQFKSLSEAFLILYKKHIVDGEEWDDNEDITKDEWKNSLENFVIPTYFRLKYDRDMSENDFWKRFLEDMDFLGVDKNWVDNFTKRNRHLKTYIMDEYSICKNIFGASEDVYFIYDFFAGD